MYIYSFHLSKLKSSIDMAATYILLPVYNELESDLFLNIVKKIVSRTRLENYLELSLMSGMERRKLIIECDPNDPSRSGEIARASLLGYWCCKNFPSFCKKLLGEQWYPSNGRKVFIGTNQNISDSDVDRLIFSSMELRVLELSVNASTLEKLKHFVSVPANICANNPVSISKKMRVFEVAESYIENGWAGLRYGKFNAVGFF